MFFVSDFSNRNRNMSRTNPCFKGPMTLPCKTPLVIPLQRKVRTHPLTVTRYGRQHRKSSMNTFASRGNLNFTIAHVFQHIEVQALRKTTVFTRVLTKITA